MSRTTLGRERSIVDNVVMTTREFCFPHRQLRSMPRTDGLWSALVNAVRDSDEDAETSRQRLAALRLKRSYATLADYTG
jgi:hypothetical protein